MFHSIVFLDPTSSLYVGINEWRYRPLDARKAIGLFDFLKRDRIVFRLEDNKVIEALDPTIPDRRPALGKVIHHNVDGTAFVKMWD